MGTERDQHEGLEARLAELEARIARLEADLSAARIVGPAQPPQSAPIGLPPAAPVAPPAPGAPPAPFAQPASVAPPLPVAPPAPVTPPLAPSPVSYWQSPRSSSSPILPTTPYQPAVASAPTNPAAVPQPAAPPVPPRIASSLGELSDRLAGRALAVVGGLALILGAIFFLSLAFSRGWIGPELRVLIGLVAGSVCVAAGGAFLERRNALLGHVLTPVGLAIISISLIGATRLYHIAPTEVGLAGALLSAVIVAMVAVRNESQLVAAFGLISVLVAPPLLGANADSTTLAFIGAVLVGTTSIALWRSWRWLPPIAFVLTVPQAAAWIGSHPAAGIAMFGISAYWALNIVAAGGEEFRRHRDDLSPSSATLLLGNAAFVVWAGFAVLGGELTDLRGLFLLAVAAVHLAVGGAFVARDGERNLFGLLTIGTGIAALTMAMPIQLGAPAVPIAWTAEAVALAWVAARRGHPYSAVVSAILYVLAALALASLYPLRASASTGLPFVDPRGAALAFFLAGVVVGVWLVRDRSLRTGLAILGLSVAMYCAAAVLIGLPFVFAATGLMVVTAATNRLLPRLPSAPIHWIMDGLVPNGLRALGWQPLVELALPALMLVFGTIAGSHLTTIELPLGEIGRASLPALPFTDAGAIGAGILIAGVLASGWILGDALGRRAALLIAGGIVAYTIPFEVEPWAVAVLWVGLGLGARLVGWRDRVAAMAFDIAAAVIIVAAALVATLIVAPPSRLVVGSISVPGILIVESVVAIVAVVIGIAAFGRSWPEPRVRRWLRYGAGAFAVYLLSVLAVDIVGLRIGEGFALEELRTQGHVVLSVLWAILGVGAFLYGLRSNVRDARQGGLLLLALATAKVFLFDLAALDVAYRVISLIALGLLLLVSAWLWQRAQPRHEAGPP